MSDEPRRSERDEPVTLSPWLPEQDRITLAAVGKLGEEAAELAGICARCVIQGLDGIEPETGVPNQVALEKEMADVGAAGAVAIEALSLNQGAMRIRTMKKIDHLTNWHELIRRHEREHGKDRT